MEKEAAAALFDQATQPRKQTMSTLITPNSHDADDYRLVLQAIQYLESNQPPRLSVTELAQALGVTPDHWQQVVDRWTGARPKCYLSPLALGCPRHLTRSRVALPQRDYIPPLPGRSSALSISWNTLLLEGNSNLHSKMLTVNYGWFQSPFGEVLSLGAERGLCGLVFYETIGKHSAIDSMRKRWPNARFKENPDAVEAWTMAAFEGGEVLLLMIGTPFQTTVWKVLLSIPSGQVTNYGEIARKVGRPKGAQAVGQANSRNPLPWLIPCHRVLNSDGSLGGFHLSQNNKLTMLAWEAFHANADSGDAASTRELQDSGPAAQDEPASFSKPVRLLYREEHHRHSVGDRSSTSGETDYLGLNIGQTDHGGERGGHSTGRPDVAAEEHTAAQPTAAEDQDAAHYRLVLQAIQYLEQEKPSRLSLEGLAQNLFTTPEQLQFVINRWTGVCPMRYLPHLHLELGQPRHLPMESFATLDRDRAMVLPGRRQSLHLAWETMEEQAASSKVLTVRYGWFESPFGEVLSLGTERGLCGMVYYGTIGKDKALAKMARRWPMANLVEDPGAVRSWTRSAYDGGEARLVMTGSPFQIIVWEALLTIPSGKVTNYKEIARKVGAEGQERKVGIAIHYNPLPWLIPCHRVLYSHGGLGGFHLSQYNKRIMLAWEALRADTA